MFDLFVYCCGFIQGMQSKHRGSRQQETGRRSWRWFVVVVILPILFGVMKMTKKEPIMGKLEAPTGPNENELNEVAEFEQNKKMTNVKYMSRCQALDNVDIAQYENKVERLGKVLNLPEAEIEELKSARYSDKEVNALEKFDLGLDGIFYFGKFTTKKRHDGNMDLAIVLYGLRWNLADQVEKSWFKDILLLQSITPKQKELCLKSWRSKAVEAFSTMCTPDLLEVVDQTRTRPGKIGEEDKATLSKLDRLFKTLEAVGTLVDFDF